MNALLFTLEYPPFKGGVANYYGNLIKYWPAPNNIFVLNNNGDKLINRHWPILKWLPAILALKKTVKENRIEHIIVGHILPLGLASLIYRQFYQIKYSIILHGMDFSYTTKIWRKKVLAKIILARAEKIVCSNAYTAGLVKSFLPKIEKNKIVVVNPGVENLALASDLTATRPTEELKQKYNLENKIVLLSVGRLVKRKGFDRVIEALPEVLKKAPNLIYAILGDGQELKNIKFLILKLKLENNVLIINNVSDNERNQWYNLCDIFIMPSRNIDGDFEGFGIVYLEANLAGKPVIAGRDGGAGDAVIDGLNGLLVDGENINEISKKIIKLASNQELRQKLGRDGKKRAIEDFNWQKQAEKIYNIIH